MWSARVFWFSKPKQMSAIASSSTVCKSFRIQRKFDIINHFKILGQIDRYKKRKEEVRRRRRPTNHTYHINDPTEPFWEVERAPLPCVHRWLAHSARRAPPCLGLARFGRFVTSTSSQAARALFVFLVRVHCTPTESSARARPLSLLSMDQVGLAMPGSSSFLFGTVQSSWYSVQLLCSVASHVEKKTKKQSLNYVNH